MKTKLLLLSALALPVAASAQIHLVSGWDFGQFTFEGLATTHPDADPLASGIPANFSSIGANNPTSTHNGVNPVSAGTGTINWSMDDATAEIVFAASGTRTINTSMADSSVFDGSFMSNTNSDPNNLGLGFTAFQGHSFSLTSNMSGYADFNSVDYSGAANFSFAAASEGAVTIEWFLGSDQIGETTLTAGNLSTFSTYTLDLPTSFYGSSSTLTAVVATGNATFTIDNVQINGVVSAVPEPSTYAALAGAAGLALAVYRRRRSA
ncbi:MAG: hypothetical protein K0R17_2935 [Rariglobus sp.]|jgi:hypothetical protein|nr:hypothetical protein [Rariglobus sp.]